MPGLFNAWARIGITDDEMGVAHALAASLKQLGCDAVVVQGPTLADPVDSLIFLGGLRQVSTFEDAVAVNREAFQWAKSIGPRLLEHGGVFVTVQDTGGDFGQSGQSGLRAWLAGLSGLVKTAGLEWPKAAVKAIDLEQNNQSPETLAARMVDELFDGGPETEVGLQSDGTRVTLISRPVPGSGASDSRYPNARQDAVIVVSGGARGVTAAVMKELAKFMQPRIVLLGRSVLVEEPTSCRDAVTDADIKKALLVKAKEEGISLTPRELGSQVRAIQANREILNTLNHLKHFTPYVQYFAVDVQNEQAVSEALSSIRQTWGPITGLVHGAGIIHDKLIVDKPLESFGDVFQTKVHGLRALLSATESDDLRFICLFSSIAARTGNIGQSDYAMANEILNKVAWYEAKRRGSACIVKSINWGAWKGGMVTPALQAHFEGRGVPLIPLDEGAGFFLNEIQNVDSQAVEIVAAPDISGLFGQSSQRTWVLEIGVDQETFPLLHDHAIDSTPVVPAVLVLHWFVSAAAACRRELSVEACERLQVVKGIRLPNFEQRAEVFSLRVQECQDDGGVRMDMTLHHQDGTLHYQGTVRMARQDEISRHNLKENPPELSRKAHRDNAFETLYPVHLFHGPSFQVIDSVETVSDEGVMAVLKSSTAVAGKENVGHTFVPLLDGGLQAARIWGIHRLGKKTLPTAIDRYVPGSNPSVPSHCVVVARTVTALKTVSDVFFTTPDGAVSAAMFGVEMHTYG